MLELRGNPGTHDIPLAMDFLRGVRSVDSSQPVMIPKYDKSQFGGLGDRAPEEHWTRVTAKPDIVILEGWCMGFMKLDEAEMANAPAELAAVNKYMDEFAQLYNELDLMLVVKIAKTQWVFDWRAQAENMMKASGKSGMSDEQIRDFVSRFMPSYDAYLPGLYESPPMDDVLLFEIDQQRVPVAAERKTARAKM